MKCPTCEGECGSWEDYGLIFVTAEWHDCGHCKGTGKLGFREWFCNWFWLTMPVETVEQYGDWPYKRGRS